MDDPTWELWAVSKEACHAFPQPRRGWRRVKQTTEPVFLCPNSVDCSHLVRMSYSVGVKPVDCPSSLLGLEAYCVLPRHYCLALSVYFKLSLFKLMSHTNYCSCLQFPVISKACQSFSISNAAFYPGFSSKILGFELVE